MAIGNVEQPRKVSEITFDDVKFTWKQGQLFDESMLSASARRLIGQKVQISGFMLPTIKPTGIAQFVLVGNNPWKPSAVLPIEEIILVDLRWDKRADYKTDPVTVQGELIVKPEKGQSGNLLVVYRLTDAEIVPRGKGS